MPDEKSLKALIEQDFQDISEELLKSLGDKIMNRVYSKINRPDYFVIDTDSYAGNFERQLCAYATGQIGECGVGQKEAEIFKVEEDPDFFEDIVVPGEPGDSEYPCWRPIKLYGNPRYFNDGMGNCYLRDNHNPEEVLKKYRETLIKHAERNRNVYADKEYGNRLADEAIKEAQTAQYSMCTAYMSVAFCLDVNPTQKHIDLMKRRAKKFCEEYYPNTRWGSKINIEGFRLVEEFKRTFAASKTV